MTTPPVSPDANISPSGLIATALTKSLCPSSVARSLPSGKDHSLMVLSADPEASVFPSGLIAIALTAAICAFKISYGTLIGLFETSSGTLVGALLFWFVDVAFCLPVLCAVAQPSSNNNSDVTPTPAPRKPRRSIPVFHGRQPMGIISGGSLVSSAYTRVSSNLGLSIFIRKAPFRSPAHRHRPGALRARTVRLRRLSWPVSGPS